MLKDLKWQSLEERRFQARLTLMHKIHHKTVDIEEQLAVKARCNNINFVPINARINAYANSFIPATIRDWNKLPPTAKNEFNLERFKKMNMNML